MEALEDLLRRAEELVDRGDYGAVVALLEPLQEEGNPEVLYTLGLACYRLEKYQEAINHLNQSLSLKSDYILALARRGLAYKALEQKELATADFEQALTIDPQDHHDWRGRGIAFGELNRSEEEFASYDKAIEIKPDYHLAWYSRGFALGKLGRNEETIVSYDKAIEIKPDFHEAWYSRGNALGKSGGYKEAIASFDQAIKFKPDYHEAWYNRGFALFNLGKYEEAIISVDKAIEIKPDFHKAWYSRGITLSKLGRYEEAIISYDKAIEIKPDDHETWFNRGNTLSELGRYEKAIASFDQALDLKPDYYNALLNRGAIFCDKLKLYKKALADFNQAIEIKPDKNKAWTSRGVALGNLGRHEEAITSHDKAIEIKPDDHLAWNNRGVELENLGRYEEAIISYDKAIEIKPNFHEAWNKMGNVLEKLGRDEEAIISYDKAIEIKPDFHEAWDNRGVALEKSGRYEEAIASYDKAIEIKPDFHEAWNNRGVALWKLGRYEEAIASYKKALKFKPDLYEAWNNLRSLATNQRLSFQDWLDLRQICEAGLERITFEQDPIRHLTIQQYYLWVCSRTQSRENFRSLVEKASLALSRYFAQTPMQEWEIQRVRKNFASFKQIEVTNLAQMGDSYFEPALELAEEWRNYRLNCLISDIGYEPAATTYQQAQQLLKPDTAIVYWHYSPVGLTTFILKHGQPLKILPPPPAPPSRNSIGIQGDIAILKQVQDLEKWLEDWKNDYTAYGKNQAPDPDHSWRFRMKLRLDSPNKDSGSLKLILNIKQLLDEHLKGIDHLILIPHRDLHLLPLHSLFPFGYTTTYLPSLQIGLNLQSLPQPATKPLLNLHQPTDSLYIELTKNIIDILSGAETQKIPNLNKAQFLHLLQANHQALQFTGHGCHDPETPENSYLNLAEDKLLLTDILRHKQLDLSSYRLICLTACESGITTQSLLDEYIGWGSTFLAKQARAVISTLWNVDVRSSVFLMIKFYQLFSKSENPLSAPQALRQSQFWLSTLDYESLADWYTELANLTTIPQYRDYLHTEAAKLQADTEKINSMERPFTNPYHWAGFICTGLLEQ